MIWNMTSSKKGTDILDYVSDKHKVSLDCRQIGNFCGRHFGIITTRLLD